MATQKALRACYTAKVFKADTYLQVSLVGSRDKASHKGYAAVRVSTNDVSEMAMRSQMRKKLDDLDLPGAITTVQPDKSGLYRAMPDTLVASCTLTDCLYLHL